MKVVSLTTHPIQYQVPVFRALAADPEIEFTALFLSDHSVKGGHDSGFGRAVQWDVPILEGYEFEFIMNQGPGNEGSGFRAYRSSGLKRLFQEMKSDVLLLPGHMVQAYWQAVWTAKACGMKVVVKPESLTGVQRQRSWLKSILRDYALKRFYGHVDVFCYTGHFASLDAKAYGFSETDSIFAPYNIDSDLFEVQREKYKHKRDHICREIGMGCGDVGLVFSGKFIDWKNPDLIIEAVQLLRPEIKARVFPIFLGDGIDFQRVFDRCRAILGDGRFSIPGFINQSELGKYYTAGDIFILPSKRGHESWGLVVNEAMTFGLPCLVSDGVGCRTDLVVEGETGHVFPDGDAGMLANWIEKLVLNDDLREKMGLQAHAHIQNYSTTEAVAGLKKALHRAIQINAK